MKQCRIMSRKGDRGATTDSYFKVKPDKNLKRFCPQGFREKIWTGFSYGDQKKLVLSRKMAGRPVSLEKKKKTRKTTITKQSVEIWGFVWKETSKGSK